MHGTAYANKAVIHCDLIMAIGARWDDRVAGKVDEFCSGAKKIHVDIDPAEVNKVIQPDVSLVGDARLTIEDLLPLVEPNEPRGQEQECGAPASAKYAERRPARSTCSTGCLTGSHAVITADVGQHQCGGAF
jgi:acetolactate synthase-1/2/3 large subunit